MKETPALAKLDNNINNNYYNSGNNNSNNNAKNPDSINAQFGSFFGVVDCNKAKQNAENRKKDLFACMLYIICMYNLHTSIHITQQDSTEYSTHTQTA